MPQQRKKSTAKWHILQVKKLPDGPGTTLWDCMQYILNFKCKNLYWKHTYIYLGWPLPTTKTQKQKQVHKKWPWCKCCDADRPLLSHPVAAFFSFSLQTSLRSVLKRVWTFLGLAGTFDCWMFWLFCCCLYWLKDDELTQKLFFFSHSFAHSLKDSIGSKWGCLWHWNLHVGHKKISF